MGNKKIITIIVPCYNEQETVVLFYNEIKRISSCSTFKKMQFKVLFVDDGSKDNTLLIIKQMASKNDNIKYISFSRNFGKEAAIYAGLKNVDTDYCALMDADLQDPPSLLEEMYLSIINDGYDCVATRRVTRKGEPVIRSFFAKKFYQIINYLSDIEIVDGARDFRLMTRQMIDAIVSIGEYNRFSKGIFTWVGFKVKWLDYENIERIAGQTKWSFWTLFLYSIDGIIAFSVVPLALASFLGILIFTISLLAIFYIIIKTLIYGNPVAGWPSLATIVSFIGGLQLLCLGIIGQYLSKTYLETKKRPVFIIKQSNL